MIFRKFYFLFLLTITVKAQVVITDITSSNLIGDAYNDGKYGGHGVMFGDADGDGDPDLYITMNNSAPMSDQFFENDGNGIFTEKALERGIDNFDTKGSHGWVWADLDNDGDFDGWNGSYSKNIPYHNKNEEPGYFENYFANSGIEDLNNGTRGVVAFDYDRDGDLDLFANNWYAYGLMESNEFYENNGDFTFTRIDNGLTNAKGDQGVCDGDFDNDGDIDLILSVFDDPSRCVEIWENVDGQFSRLFNTGISLCGTVDGVTFWDMNNDGWLDLVSGEKIYLNNGNKTFSEVPNVPAGNRFMRGIADLNNDGFWDMVAPGLDMVYINNGDLTFTSLNYSTGTINDPRCVSFADIDGDGDVDFVLGQRETYNRLYRNDYDGGNRYLFTKLKTANGQRGAFGAKVYIYTTDGDTLISYRQAHSNHGYLSQDDQILHFGCGMRDSVKVKVVFLNNNVYEFITNTNKIVKIIDAYQDNIPPAIPNNFIAKNLLNAVELSWSKSEESDLSHYEIDRSSEFDFLPDTMVTFTFSTTDTVYIDSNLIDGNKYYYRIAAVDDFGNKSNYSDKIEVIITDVYDDNLQIPFNYRLYQNYPNPFNPVTNIKFALPNASKISIDVYNILGEKIGNLVSKFMEPGIYNLPFDGKELRSGIYIYRLQAEEFVEVNKMLLVK